MNKLLHLISLCEPGVALRHNDPGPIVMGHYGDPAKEMEDRIAAAVDRGLLSDQEVLAGIHSSFNFFEVTFTPKGALVETHLIHHDVDRLLLDAIKKIDATGIATQKSLREGIDVQWTSQAGGRTKTKTGRIVQVIPPRGMPSPTRFPALHATCGMSRKNESYVVQVGNKFYWPVASRLEFA